MVAIQKPDADDLVDATRAAHHHVRGALRRPRPAEAANEANFAGAAIDVANNPKASFMDRVGQFTGVSIMGLQFAQPITNGVISAIGGVGKFAGIKAVVDWSNKTKLTVTKLSEKTIEDVLGGNKYSQSIGEKATKASAVVGDALDHVSQKSGASSFLPRFNNWRANANYGKMRTKLDGVDAIHANLPASVKPHATAILQQLRNSTHAGGIDDVAFANNTKAFAESADALEKTTKAEQAALNSFAKVTKLAQKTVSNHAAAQSWGNIGATVKELPKGIAKSQVIPGVMNTAFIGMSAVGMYGAAQGFTQNLASLKEMAGDITGKKYSTMQVLTGNVPKPVAEARRKLLANFGVTEVTGAVGLLVNIMSASRGKIGALAFIAPQIAGMAAGAVIGDSVLSYYKGFKEAHKAGKLTVDDYAGFLGQASPELQKHGGAGSAFTQAIAKKYAAENLSPEQMLRKIDNGSITTDIKSLIAENEAAKPSRQKSHVAALTEPSTKPVLPNSEPKEILGEHTSKMVKDAAAAGNALGVS